ncbi:MAG: GH116 family glycosyl-hydrolase [Rhodobacteraceae bacterium]|nr:GH116 family glycosyl-hydrolase [Paracoccaceae bacterium]
MSKDYFTYDGEATRYATFPLGGIGAGSIGIGADGRLKDWEIYNRPAKGSLNGFTHFAVKAMRGDQLIDIRLLNGEYKGNAAGELQGTPYNTFGFGPRRETMAGFPWFNETSLQGPYPVAELSFKDVRFPGSVKMEAFSPFVPLESRISSMPAAHFEVEITNSSEKDIDYSIYGCIGFPFKEAVVDAKTGSQTSLTGRAICKKTSVDYGELCLATDHADTSFQRNTFRGSWFDTMEVYWQDISAPGNLKDRFYGVDGEKAAEMPLSNSEHGVLASHVTIKPGQSKKIRYIISWFVPNVTKYWDEQSGLLDEQKPVPEVWTNYYASEWSGAESVAEEAFDKWDYALDRTKRLKELLIGTTAPVEVIDAISANLSIVKTATTMRLQDGTFYGWEGCHPDSGCCEGSCTHVWNYQQVLPFLFPDLERSMREADYKFNQVPDGGGMAFRLKLPLGIGTGLARPCVDGQMGNVLKTYRDFKLFGEIEWLKKMWPTTKAALEYAWHSENYDSWDPDQTGVMTGRQHHTLDMELFGPNSWLNGFYLAALQAGAKMAEAIGDSDAAAQYREIYERGRKWTNEHLFNGEYFIQKIDLDDKSILDKYDTTKGHVGIIDADIYGMYWSDETNELKYQIGDGCEIDQVLAEWHCALYGLDSVFDEDKFKKAVLSIYKHNFKHRLGDAANPCRVFGMGDEAGTVMCEWPEGARRPRIPVPYSQETMHGFEYAFGTQLMMIGELEKGFEVFKAVRDRYRGDNRNPWNEIECGSNYARSMASYAALLVLSGFEFDAAKKFLGFNPATSAKVSYKTIWSNGQSWGSIEIDEGEATLSVEGGQLELTTLMICKATFDLTALQKAGAAIVNNDFAVVTAGQILRVSIAGNNLHSNF